MSKNIYKIAICDDNPADIRYIRDIVCEWGENRSIEIHTFPSAEAFLFQYEEERGWDILLLDVEMGRMDGVTLAKELRRDNETVQIIFITGYSDYIADGYEVEALHYLLKPVKKDRLLHVLERAAEHLKKNEREIVLKTPEEIVLMPIREILFLEVRQNYVTVHGKREVTVKRTLSEFEKELDDRFFRMGRSFLVNLRVISRVTKKEVFLKDGSVLPLPRGQYEPLNRAIITRM